MADNKDVMACPLCQGHGELRRPELDELLAHDPEFRRVIERYQAKARGLGATASVTQNANGRRNFEQEVHRWNPEVPIFRRSPKE